MQNVYKACSRCAYMYIECTLVYACLKEINPMEAKLVLGREIELELLCKFSAQSNLVKALFCAFVLSIEHGEDRQRNGERCIFVFP